MDRFVGLLFITLAFVSVYGKKFNYEFVTCGSSMKLLNVAHSVRLHSHDVKYGSGSGQQSVTAVDSSDDHNSYWRVNGKASNDCVRGNPVKCGQVIRFQHLATGRNLHSHTFLSPLSRNLEVSAFGERGEGDEGDYWTVVCNEDHWSRNDNVRIKHVATDAFLHVSGDTFGRPIHGQREVSGLNSYSEYNFWKAAEGIYIKPSDVNMFDYRVREDL